jgi:hypothetical protein
MAETSIARLLADLVGRLPAVMPMVGLYAAGSLGTRDFEPDRSSLDLVALLAREPDATELAALATVQRDLARQHPAAERLRCLYVAAPGIRDAAREWPCWTGSGLDHRRLTAITRTELHDHGVVVAGEPVAGQIPYVTPEELVEEVRDELRTVWLPATDQLRPWLDDAFLDLGLTALPRARAAVAEGALMTKTQAIAHLSDFDVPDWVRQDMLARRRGWARPMGVRVKVRRARIARDVVRRGAGRLLEEIARGGTPS